MRKKIVAANWKMNLTFQEGKELVKNILDANLRLSEDREVVICPPFLYLVTLHQMLKDHPHFYAGAQNASSERSGAYTGEISAGMLQSIGVPYVILGHSERRQYFGETNALLQKKVALALNYGLRPVFCCGEALEVREKEGQNEFVEKQLTESLFELSPEEMKKVVIAYEPVWAIGTGRTATPEQAQDMHAFIRSKIKEKYGHEIADEQTILYGGSCKPDNAAALFGCPDVDGALVGGASLKADAFTAIIKAL